jgi:peptidoglycan/LPS O-acetylase OafA/YrhL
MLWRSVGVNGEEVVGGGGRSLVGAAPDPEAVPFVGEAGRVGEPSGARAQLGYLPELDGLRGVAALMVVLFHVSEAILFMPYRGRLLTPVLRATELGFFGVDIFFALSGFLITRGLLARAREQRFYRNFYVRRVLRLVPPYLLTLLLVGFAIPGSGRYLGLSAVYLANMSPWFGVAMAYPVLWSLSVEEHFYLVWPWLVRRCSRSGLLVLCAALCLVIPTARVVEAVHGGLNIFLSWNRFDGLAWGAIAALLLRNEKALRRFARSAGVGAVVVFAVALVVALRGSKYGGVSLIYSSGAMCSTCVIGLVAGGARIGVLRWRPLRFCGDVSYWVYLIHPLALILLLRFPRAVHPGLGTWVWLASGTLGLSLATGALVRRFVEEPALSLKKYFA